MSVMDWVSSGPSLELLSTVAHILFLQGCKSHFLCELLVMHVIERGNLCMNLKKFGLSLSIISSAEKMNRMEKIFNCILRLNVVGLITRLTVVQSSIKLM